MAKGYLAFVLHAHLPYVRHPEFEAFLEERWFFEAVTETYIPLLKFFERAAREGVPFRVTLSLSPTLLAMMEDPLLQDRYRAHTDKLIRLCEWEMDRNRDQGHIRWLAEMYRGLFIEAKDYFDKWEGRLSQACKALVDRGVLELMTCAATHGILPLLNVQPKSVEAQVVTGLDYFESVFGFRARGLWLPECGWTPGLDPVLRREGVRYFFLESHGIDHAAVTPFHGVYAPIYTPEGVAAFGRDRDCTKEVWSANEGYPGDTDYREFYRDIGHDLEFDYIDRALGGGVRSDTGIKYHRITGPTPHKALYDPEAGKNKAALHAGIFLDKRVHQVDYLRSAMETAPIIVAPFDAELFGHWWFEGPQWLDFVIRKTAYDQDTVALVTLSDYLDRHPVHQVGDPGTSTWGHAGYFETWLNGRNDWIYNHYLECGARMERLAQRYAGNGAAPSPLVDRALKQCMRELLLAQCSDWPFIISNCTAENYANRRVKDHVTRFHYSADAIESGTIDEDYLRAIEYADNVFPDIDYACFARKAEAGAAGPTG
ncbi:MAG: DUF1957 domain-containing protein [Alphaproteobacteria bacterium]|jgi:1,4-alpha-glucan branching enzyme|nr:DUF1957 domain-containing protein [Alphaproteobacteria bacterium]